MAENLVKQIVKLSSSVCDCFDTAFVYAANGECM
jgi:hypothetical protein